MIANRVMRLPITVHAIAKAFASKGSKREVSVVVGLEAPLALTPPFIAIMVYFFHPAGHIQNDSTQNRPELISFPDFATVTFF
mmetsp:Transcript_126888/g.219682  ORF Transcript_126888/g.219682 Transcript_126888/m.219682 type:complete len:83 (+) Transcript_126888:187-435(+)